MRRAYLVLVALVLVFSLSCISTMAEEGREENRRERQAERDHDRDERVEREYKVIRRTTESPDRLAAELERQREDIRGLREEVRSLREEIRSLREQILHLLAGQIEFMQGMLNREHEVRLRQSMEGREWEREREREREWEGREENIEREIRHLQEEVERNPGDPELRLKLGHTLWEVENIEGAYRQFKAALEIAPDFEEAYGALEKLRADFPDVSRIPVEKPLRDSAGTVISANKEEIKLQIFEGDDVTFKVPFIQNEEGKWVLNEDFAHFASSLKPGARIKILWQEMEDRRIIRKVERLEDDE